MCETKHYIYIYMSTGAERGAAQDTKLMELDDALEVTHADCDTMQWDRIATHHQHRGSGVCAKGRMG